MSLSEGKYTGEFILSEAPGKISRDEVTVDIGAATTLNPGQVLGKLTGTGHYVPVDDSATDGSETAVAILYGKLVNAGSPDSVAAVVVDFSAEVREDDLEWGGSDDAAGIVQLFALGIKVRS